MLDALEACLAYILGSIWLPFGVHLGSIWGPFWGPFWIPFFVLFAFNLQPIVYVMVPLHIL